MSAANLISSEEFLRMPYSADREYRDGAVVERHVGTLSHSRLEGALASYARKRRKQWNIAVYIALTIHPRGGWYPIVDVALYRLPRPTEDIPNRPPFLWIEVLSPEDRVTDVWKRANEAIACGTSYFWMIDPKTLDSELWTASGRTWIADGVLRLPDSAIVIPLAQALED